MADEFIPPPQTGQGPGPQGMRPLGGAPDYRQLQNPAQVRTDLPSSGAAERAQELGRVFKEFSGEALNVSNTLGTQAGAIAGAAAGATGHPQYRQGLERFSAYSQAFNNAATGAYAIQAEAAADDTAARLRVEANNDPAHFATTFSAVRDAVVKNAPAQAQGMLTELYNKHLAAGLAAISGDQAEEIKKTQASTYQVGVEKQVSRVANLQGSANPNDQNAALDEQVKLSLMIDGGANAGLYSKAEAQLMHISTARTITEQVFSTQVDRELEPGGDPMKLLERFREAHIANSNDTTQPQILSEPEFQKLMQDAKAKIQTQRLIEAYGRQNGKTAEQLRFEAGDVNATSLLFKGSLTPKQLGQMVESHDLTPERATSLGNILAAGVGGKGNADLYFKLHNSPSVLDLKPADIARYVGPGGLNGEQADKLSQDIARRNATYEGSQSFKSGVSAIAVALKIPAGASADLLSDQQRKAYSEAVQDYRNRVNAIDPSKRESSMAGIAQDVVKVQQQHIAAADLQQDNINRSSFISNYGPNSQSPMPDVKYQERLKFYDGQIKDAQRRAKGE